MPLTAGMMDDETPGSVLADESQSQNRSFVVRASRKHMSPIPTASINWSGFRGRGCGLVADATVRRTLSSSADERAVLDRNDGDRGLQGLATNVVVSMNIIDAHVRYQGHFPNLSKARACQSICMLRKVCLGLCPPCEWGVNVST